MIQLVIQLSMDLHIINVLMKCFSLFTYLFLPAAKPRRSMDDIWPYDDLEIVAIRGQKSMITYVIEVTEFNFEVRSDLRGRLEAVMASEAVGGNMHMDTRVIRVADVKSEVI